MIGSGRSLEPQAANSALLSSTAPATGPWGEPTPPIFNPSSRLPGAGSFPNNTSKKSAVGPGLSRFPAGPGEVHVESIYSRRYLPTKAARAEELR
jgi:hypothetical protein